MEYWTWELKAILWIGTGLLLAVTSVMKHKLKDQKLSDSILSFRSSNTEQVTRALFGKEKNAR
jgi:hypothetical protein